MFPFIDEQVLTLGEAVNRNFDKWDYLGDNLWDEPEPLPSSYSEEIVRLKDWLSKRISWLDQQLQGDCVPVDPLPSPQLPVSIFPNPSQSSLTIRFEGMTDMRVELYDISGRMVKRIDGADDQIVLNDFDEYAAGVYIVSLSKGEFLYLYKVIKY